MKIDFITHDVSKFKDTSVSLQRQMALMSKEIIECNILVGQYKDLLNRDTEKLEEFGKIDNDIMDL